MLRLDDQLLQKVLVFTYEYKITLRTGKVSIELWTPSKGVIIKIASGFLGLRIEHRLVNKLINNVPYAELWIWMFHTSKTIYYMKTLSTRRKIFMSLQCAEIMNSI